MKSQRVRLAIDFDSREKLAEWVESLRDGNILPEDLAVYRMDRDDITARGVTPNNTYIVKREGEKDESQRLVIQHKVTQRV